MSKRGDRKVPASPGAAQARDGTPSRRRVDDAEALGDPVMAHFYTYWRERCRGRLLPGRTDIDPQDFPQLLPFVLLVDVLRRDGKTRFRYRLMGAQAVAAFGRNLTGKDPARSLGAEGPGIVADYMSVVESGAPGYWRRRCHAVGKSGLHYECLALPLAADGRRVDMILALVVPEHVSRPVLGRT